MRVFPWCQYQVVAKHHSDCVLRLPSLHKGVPCCTSFVCFCHTSTTQHKTLSQPKVGSIQQQDALPNDFVPHRSGNSITDGDDGHESTIYLKSNLKNTYSCSGAVLSNDNIDGALGDRIQEVQFFSCSEGKRVQWTDASGKELVQIREFEPSEPDEDCKDKNAQRCACVIM